MECNEAIAQFQKAGNNSQQDQISDGRGDDQPRVIEN